MSAYTPTSFLLLHAWVLVFAVLTALLEVQIEGAYGWAARLPTWRVKAPWVRKLMSGKDLTGYHVYLMSLQLALLHFPVVFVGWSWLFEVTILCLYFTYAILWDFLWFVLNPSFGLDRFFRREVWWFRRWVGPFPVEYYLYLTISAALATGRGFFDASKGASWLGGISLPLQQLIGWACGLAVSMLMVGIILLLTRLVQGRRSVGQATPQPEVLPLSDLASMRLELERPEGVTPAVLPKVGSRPVTRPVLPRDSLLERVDEEERLQRAQWLIQFGEIIFGLVLGLSIDNFAKTHLFSLDAPTSLGAVTSFADKARTASPLLVLHAWIVFFLILYWYNMRLEAPIFAVFIRQSSGVLHLVLIVVLGFIVFQALDAVTPDFVTLQTTEVIGRVDTVLRWLGIVLVFDALAQFYIRMLWLQSCKELEAEELTWKPLLPGIRNYYGYLFPATTFGLLAIYLVAFFPGASFTPSWSRYMLPSLIGATSPAFIATAFVLTNLIFEAYLGLERRIVHDVATAYRLDRRRRLEGTGGAMPVTSAANEPGEAQIPSEHFSSTTL